MTLTLAHWVFAIVTLLIIGAIIFRKGVVVPALVGTFAVAAVYKKSIVGGFTAIFNASLVAAQELFSIFLIMTFMLALLNSLKEIEADKRMVAPVQKLMINGHVSYFVLIIITYVISLFFWPTPAVPLICALLVPAAVRAGLPVMGAAVAIAIAGQGMALASDYVMQVVPTVTATAAGIDPSVVADKSLLLSIVTGVIAIVIAYITMRKDIRKPNAAGVETQLNMLPGSNVHGLASNELAATSEEINQGKQKAKWGKLFSIVVPVAMLLVVAYMFTTKFSNGRMGGLEGGDGAAFIGGVAVLLLILVNVTSGKGNVFDKIGEQITEGFVFSFKIMGGMIPIAGFFFLASSDFSGRILSLGEKAVPPSFLFELVQSAQTYVPSSTILSAFFILIIGMITGLDGSGFAGLSLSGTLASAMADSNGLDAASLAAIGQVGTIFTGGGALVAWSSLVAVAGFCGVSAFDLARKNFLPVVIGLLISTILAIVIW